MKGAHAMYSLENVDAENGHEVSADDRGDATEKGVPPSTPEEDRSEWFNRGSLLAIVVEI